MEDFNFEFEDIPMPDDSEVFKLALPELDHTEVSSKHSPGLMTANQIVLCRLETQQSCVPQLSKRDIKARLFIWQAWVVSGKSYQSAADLIGMYRSKGASRQHVYYIIRKMKEAGILDGLPEH